MKLEAPIYFKTFGRYFRVTAIYTDAAAANKRMAEAGSTDAVIGVDGDFVFLADKNDQGLKVL
jgi:hypothetical protein